MKRLSILIEILLMSALIAFGAEKPFKYVWSGVASKAIGGSRGSVAGMVPQ